MDQFVGELGIVGFNFPPRNFAFCNGQIMSISQNTALFSLLGTTYGGNGTTTFALPNLQSRVPVHFGQGPGLSAYTLGQVGGSEAVTLITNQLPVHNHTPLCITSQGTAPGPVNQLWAGTTGDNLYAPGAPNAPMNPAAIGPSGGGQPHNNLQPYLVLNFVIALFGVFPSRN